MIPNNQPTFIEFLRGDSQRYLEAKAALARFDKEHPKAWTNLELWHQRMGLAYEMESNAAAIADLVAHYLNELQAVPA